MEYLPVLAYILPAEPRRRQATLSLARRVLEARHLLQSKITGTEQHQALHLKSQLSFASVAKNLMTDLDQLSRQPTGEIFLEY